MSLNDGKYYSVKAGEFATDEDFQRGVLASSAIPIIWAPVPEVQTTDGPLRQLVDGGIKNVSPLGDVIEDIQNDPTSDYTLLIINCNTHDPVPENFEDRNIAQIALRSLTDISLSEIFNNDIREYLRINDILQQVGDSKKLFNFDYKQQKRTDQQLRAFKTIIIQPDAGVLGDSLVSTQSLFDKRHVHGIEKARKALTLLKVQGINSNTILT